MSYQSDIIATSGLVGYWPHDEVSGNLDDKSTSGNDATVSGATLNQASLLLSGEGKSASYDGTNDNASIGDVAALTFAHTDAFTVEAIIRPTFDGSAGTQRAIIAKMLTSGTFRGWELFVEDNGNGTGVFGAILISDFGANNYEQVKHSIPLTSGQNYHVAMRWSAAGGFTATANTVSLSVNGMAETPATHLNFQVTATISSSATATIGSRGASRYFKGRIAEVAVYNRHLSHYELVGHALAAHVYDGPADPSGRVKVILDTDLDTDCDDYGDLSLLCALHQQRQVDLLAVVSTTSQPASAPVCRAILDYYEETEIPVGAYQDSDLTSGGNNFTDDVRDFFRPGDTRTNYDDEVTVYRTALAAAPDGSVTILMTGFAKGFRNLLESAADGISALDGMALVTAKVSRVIAVAGLWPKAGSAEFNINNDKTSWDYVADNCPVPIVWCGIEVGNPVVVRPPTGADPDVNPVKRGYDELLADSPAFFDGDGRRQAWGMLGALFAADGATTRFAFGPEGVGDVNTTTGINNWAESGSGDQWFLLNRASDSSLQTEIEALLAAEPNPGGAIPVFMHHFRQQGIC